MTRSDIRDQLRFRLSETTAGTWTDAELNNQLYYSEKKVSEDAIITRSGLLTESTATNVVANQYQYILPSDFIRELLVFHLYSNRHYEIDQSNIALMLDRFREDETSDRILKYDVHGTTPAAITGGVATSGSNTTLNNADIDWTSLSITADVDYAENITDGSRSLITAVADTGLTLSGLSGGTRDSFRLGDEYQIVEGESTRQVLNVWPVPSGADMSLQESYTGDGDSTLTIGDDSGTEYQAAQSFQLDTDVVIKSIEVNFGSETGSPIGAINVRIETNSSGTPSGTLADADASAAIQSPSDGWNEAEFANEFRLAKDTTYHIVAKTITQDSNNYYTWDIDTDGSYSDGQASSYDGTTWTNQTGDLPFKINGSTTEEKLIIHYVREPREMTADTDNSELPSYAREAVYLWAQYLALQKSPGVNSTIVANLRTLYETEIQKIKDRLRDNGDVDRIVNVMFGSGEEELIKGVPLSTSLPLGVA